MSAHELVAIRSKVSAAARAERLNQRSCLVWFTGLSGAGKSTLGVQLEEALFEKGYVTYLLDGDAIRSGLSSNLTFTEEDRIENIRRIAEVVKLFLDSGVVVLAAFISPFQANRDTVKSIVGKENYIEVFVDTPLEVCEQRDTKGLYKKARAGQLKNFTGIDSPYERPLHPHVIIQTEKMSLPEATKVLLDTVERRIKLK